MTVIYIGLASVLLSLLMLWGVGKFIGQKTAAPEPVDVASTLRELLLARAEGRIDNDEFERQQAALHADLLQAPASKVQAAGRAPWRWLLPLILLLVAGGVYWGYPTATVGDKSAAVEEMAKLPEIDKNAQANSGGDLNTAVKKLAEKMANDPNNGDGWLLLAKTYGELRRYAEAADAYGKAAALLPPDATLLSDWADSYVMARDRKWDAEGRKIVKRALDADPKHVKSLALAGSEAFSRSDYKAAVDFWKRMKNAAPADSMDAKLADANIAEANAMISGKKPAAESAPAADLASISGVITLSPKLSSKVAAQDTVFIVAKSADGAGPPLAVKRFKGADFPIKFQLDDSAAILPGRSISQFPEIQLSARVSKSGDANAQKGDIYAAPLSARLGATNLQLELNLERQ